jgi:hypothetical protein
VRHPLPTAPQSDVSCSLIPLLFPLATCDGGWRKSLFALRLAVRKAGAPPLDPAGQGPDPLLK